MNESEVPVSDEEAHRVVAAIRGGSGAPPQPVDHEAVGRFLRRLRTASRSEREDRLRQAEIWIRAGNGYQHRGEPVSLETMAAFLIELQRLHRRLAADAPSC